MALTLLERETIINYNDAEGTANIFTASEMVKNRMKDLGEWKQTNGGWEIDVPKGWVKVKRPRPLSDKQREVLNKARINSMKARSKA